MNLVTGECVVFGLHGVCRLIGINKDETDGSENYVLQPVGDQRSHLFVPVGSETALQKIKPVLSESMVMELMDLVSTMEEKWVANENIRKNVFHNVIVKGDRRELLQMIKSLDHQQVQLKTMGKRLHRIDEKFLKDAKKVLYGEFAHVLGKTLPDIEMMVNERLTYK